MKKQTTTGLVDFQVTCEEFYLASLPKICNNKMDIMTPERAIEILQTEAEAELRHAIRRETCDNHLTPKQREKLVALWDKAFPESNLPHDVETAYAMLIS